MCPLCLTTAALIAAGTGGLTGLTALLIGRRSSRRSAPLTATKEMSR
jgi:hypothetical protein